MESLGKRQAFGELKRRWELVSFSQKRSVGWPSQCSWYGGSSLWRRSVMVGEGAVREGLGEPARQDQVLRNQIVGRTWSGAGSGPRLWAVIWMRMSSGAALAYSM